jgi:hypothetical protein
VKELKAQEAVEPKEGEEEINPNGQLVSALRQQTKLEAPLEQATQFAERTAPLDSQWRELRTKSGNRTSVTYLAPTEKFTDKEKEIHAAINQYMQQVAPALANRTFPARRLRVEGRPVQAVYQPVKDELPYLLYSLYDPDGKFKLPEDLLGSVRHETMHDFFRRGYVTDKEWKTLQEASAREDWRGKYNIDARYPDASEDLKTEESIAEEFGHWNLKPDATHITADIFQKWRDFFLKMRDVVIEKLGFDPKVEDLFHRIESGEVGRRTKLTPRPTGVLAQREELPRTLSEKIASLMLNKERRQKYLADMAKRDREDAEFQTKIADQRARQQQTSEWKANRS